MGGGGGTVRHCAPAAGVSSTQCCAAAALRRAPRPAAPARAPVPQPRACSSAAHLPAPPWPAVPWQRPRRWGRARQRRRAPPRRRPCRCRCRPRRRPPPWWRCRAATYTLSHRRPRSPWLLRALRGCPARLLKRPGPPEALGASLGPAAPALCVQGGSLYAPERPPGTAKSRRWGWSGLTPHEAADGPQPRGRECTGRSTRECCPRRTEKAGRGDRGKEQGGGGAGRARKERAMRLLRGPAPAPAPGTLGPLGAHTVHRPTDATTHLHPWPWRFTCFVLEPGFAAAAEGAPLASSRQPSPASITRDRARAPKAATVSALAAPRGRSV